jgi:hypothetical protein
MTDIIAAAGNATEAVENEIWLALAALGNPRNRNALGVYRERMPVVESLEIARAAITRALAAIGGTPWPGPADYEEE